MKNESQTFVLNTEVVGSRFDTGKENMKLIEKPADKVWQNKDTGKYAKGDECPFQSGTLIAGIGDPVPDVKLEPKKAKPKAQTKAVKPEGNK
jgi:hypothetical protein